VGQANSFFGSVRPSANTTGGSPYTPRKRLPIRKPRENQGFTVRVVCRHSIMRWGASCPICPNFVPFLTPFSYLCPDLFPRVPFFSHSVPSLNSPASLFSWPGKLCQENLIIHYSSPFGFGEWMSGGLSQTLAPAKLGPSPSRRTMQFSCVQLHEIDDYLANASNSAQEENACRGLSPLAGLPTTRTAIA
jgi:hypothetical protein